MGRGHKLTFLLGNHDLELSLPEVRRTLLQLLTQDRPARIEFLFDGEAYTVADVLVEHGNRYDGWNSVAYGALRAVRSCASRNETPWPFVAPAGSQLVAKVMNPLKQHYRFIDLLKPENEAVLPILCALEPDLIGHLRNVLPLWIAKLEATGTPGRVPESETRVAAHGGKSDRVPQHDKAAAPPPPCDEFDFSHLEDDEIDSRVLACAEQILDESYAQLKHLLDASQGGRVPPEQTAVGASAITWLSSALSLWRMRGKIPQERLRLLGKALAAHSDTIATTFDLTSDDPPYHLAAERLTDRPGFRVVIFGHTHLPKAIRLKTGGVYFNTGTWCPTIRLDPRFYAADADERAHADLSRFVEDLAENRLDGNIQLQTLFAHVKVKADATTLAALREFNDDGSVRSLFDESQ